MDKADKRVLVLSYYFPPAGGPGVQRVLKFVKYLPLYGWNPVVVTVAGGDFPARDDSMLDEIPGNIPVYRIPAVEPYSLYRKFTGKERDQTIPVGVLAKENGGNITEQIARWIRANLFVPDARVGWTIPVVRQCRYLIRRYNIQLMFSSSPPHSLQLSALRLTRSLGIPWIADFRDPWTDIYYYQQLNRSIVSRKVDAYFEGQVLRDAARITTVSPSLARGFGGVLSEDKVHVIYNGFDREDFPQESQTQPDKFRISYVGNFKSNQNISSLWQSLEEILLENEDFSRDFQLRLTGNTHPDIRQSLGKYSLLEHTQIESYVPHTEAVNRMMASAVLLFIIPQAPDNRGILTGKLFDYLASGRPFLAVGPPDGDAAKILRDVKAGEMIAPESKEEIRDRILYLYHLWKDKNSREAAPKKALVSQFERKKLTGQLADSFDRLITDNV